MVGPLGLFALSVSGKKRIKLPRYYNDITSRVAELSIHDSRQSPKNLSQQRKKRLKLKIEPHESQRGREWTKTQRDVALRRQKRR